ncbi:ABC transporter permease [Nonomuraea fuscirosea]|jgi:peptide/nickel transport system permease protein|uniref:Peptide/nickel transport system permease protein n=2 Tax=Nonomuraea fuscirosea TaxID=1291556 RepID=A0A2T0N4P3_9ACTN|nr:ABC transporter permease [Nonomuraea fuscirosea]PRX67315.1 peptide/nickel transport system permease protein [Nonomuraea fuscirosea]WSA57672.1 ABC transporter permease [Nonomuraea fuscirosea]
MTRRLGVRRLVRFAVSLGVLMVVSFAMIHLIPGDPVRAALGPAAPLELVEARRAALGLDRPLPEQLLTYVTGVVTGDFGTSFLTGEPVGEVIASRLPNTLSLALLATAVALLIAVPLGMWAAVRTENGRNRGTELGFSATTGTAVAVPEFLYAIALVTVFAIALGWFPPAGKAGPLTYVLPVLALSLGPAAMIARISRVETLRELAKDYVRLARAKRLPAARLHLRHVLPNTLTATLTVGGLLLTSLIAGGVLVEYVFAWPGLGLKIVESITQKDYPVAQGVILVYGALVLVVNLAVDLVLGALDPTSAIKEA